MTTLVPKFKQTSSTVNRSITEKLQDFVTPQDFGYTGAGDRGFAAGSGSLINNTTGVGNVAIGYQAAQSNTTGNHNVAIGWGAGAFNATQDGQVAIGLLALQNSTGNGNTAVGGYSGYTITTGFWNTSLGLISLQNVTTGSYNVSVGTNSMEGAAGVAASQAAARNTAIGYGSFNRGAGDNNTAIGYNALTLGNCNDTTAIGYGALSSFSSANANTANTAVGHLSQLSNASGYYNTSLGYSTLSSIASNTANTAIGYNVMPQATANECTVVGSAAGQAITTGSGNNLHGFQAGKAITTGANNVCVGLNAGNSTFPTTTGSQNIFIGNAAGGAAAANNYEIVIGFGIDGKGGSTGFISPAGGAMYQGNNSASWTTTSDQRIKENIVNLDSGLSIINALRPVEFDYIETKKHDVSFIAQEYQLVLPDQVFEHDASTAEKIIANSDKLLGIQQNLVPYLVKAIQELKAEIDILKAK